MSNPDNFVAVQCCLAGKCDTMFAYHVFCYFPFDSDPIAAYFTLKFSEGGAMLHQNAVRAKNGGQFPLVN